MDKEIEGEKPKEIRNASQSHEDFVDVSYQNQAGDGRLTICISIFASRHV